MKALIIEINENIAIALTQKGDYLKIPLLENYVIGHEINLPTKYMVSRNIFGGNLRHIAAIAAVFMLILSITGGSYAYYTPYSYINLDINPSLEITANIFNVILDIKGINEDGSKIASSINFNNSNIQSGISGIIDKASELGYLKSNSDNSILLSISSNNPKTIQNIESLAQSNLSEHTKQKSVLAAVYFDTGDIKRFNAAKKKGLSPGKYNMIQKLYLLDENIIMEDYKNKPIKDIKTSITKLNKEKIKGDSSENLLTPQHQKDEKPFAQEDGPVKKDKEQIKNNGKPSSKANESSINNGKAIGKSKAPNRTDEPIKRDTAPIKNDSDPANKDEPVKKDNESIKKQEPRLDQHKVQQKKQSSHSPVPSDSKKNKQDSQKIDKYDERQDRKENALEKNKI